MPNCFAWLILVLSFSVGCAAERIPVWSCPPIRGYLPENRSVTAFRAPPGSAPAGAEIRAFSPDVEEVGSDTARADGSILMGLRSSESLDDVDIELRIRSGDAVVQKIIHIAPAAPTDLYRVARSYRSPRRYVTYRLEPTPVEPGSGEALYGVPVERAMIINLNAGRGELSGSLPELQHPWEQSIVAAETDWWMVFLRHGDGETSGCWENGLGSGSGSPSCSLLRWAEGLCSVPVRDSSLIDDAGPGPAGDGGSRDAGPPPD